MNISLNFKKKTLVVEELPRAVKMNREMEYD